MNGSTRRVFIIIKQRKVVRHYDIMIKSSITLFIKVPIIINICPIYCILHLFGPIVPLYA